MQIFHPTEQEQNQQEWKSIICDSPKHVMVGVF